MSMSSTTSSTFERTSDSLEVYLLGVVEYEAALALQEQLVYEISGRNDTQGALLLCEHPPMISVGRQGSWAHILADPSELISRQMDVRHSNRGGGCIVHAPGQLAVYPILPLDRLEIGLGDYRQSLEESVLDVCDELHVAAYRRPELPGCWCRCGQFAHLGVAVKSWVTYHGMFINVSPTMELQQLVDADGLGGRVTSLAATRVRVTSMHKFREGLIRHLASRFGFMRSHVYAGHPLLKRKKKRVYVGA